MKPGERPQPRASTRTQAYPCGTHFSGSQTSQAWYRFEEPAATSGCLDTMAFHASGYPSGKWRPLPYGP